MDEDIRDALNSLRWVSVVVALFGALALAWWIVHSWYV
jgi:hypothetical protein